jgi:hypothetical protein
LQPMADDGVCAGADVILASYDLKTGSNDKQPSLNMGAATGPAYSLVGGGTLAPLTAARINGMFPVGLGKRMVIHAVAMLQTEAFDVSVGGVFGAGQYDLATSNKWVSGQAIL